VRFAVEEFCETSCL